MSDTLGTVDELENYRNPLILSQMKIQNNPNIFLIDSTTYILLGFYKGRVSYVSYL